AGAAGGGGGATRGLLVAAAILSLCAVLLGLARRRPAAAHALALLAAAELIAFARAHRATAPPAMPYPEVWAAAAVRAGDERGRHTLEAVANQGMLRGHRDVGAYAAAAPGRYAALVQAPDATAESEPAGERAPRLRGLVSLLRWRYLFGVTPAGQAAVITFDDPLPRALL